MHAKSGMIYSLKGFKAMNDQTVREIIKNGIEANLTPILKSIFDQMKCHNCIHLNKETMKCPRTGLKVGEGTKFHNWGCSKFSIDEESFDVEIDSDLIQLDQLKEIFAADDHVVYQEQENMVLIQNKIRIATIGFDGFSHKIKDIYFALDKFTSDQQKEINIQLKNKIIVG